MKKIYISEEQKKVLKKTIAAQDQVGGKVNAGIMDAVAGGAMCETTDVFGGEAYSKSESITFITPIEGGSNKVYSSDEIGITHWRLLKRLMADGVISYFPFNSKDCQVINPYMTGRYWVNLNTISLYKTPMNEAERNCTLNAIQQLGLDQNTIDVDFWDTNRALNIRSQFVLPFKWFINGTLDDLLQMGVYLIVKRNYGLYQAFLGDFKTYLFDRDGNIINNNIQESNVGLSDDSTITLYHGVNLKGLEFNLENNGFIPRVCSEGGPKAIWMSERMYGYPFIFKFDMPRDKVEQLTNVDYIYTKPMSFNDFNCELAKARFTVHYPTFMIEIDLFDKELLDRQMKMIPELPNDIEKMFEKYPLIYQKYVKPVFDGKKLNESINHKLNYSIWYRGYDGTYGSDRGEANLLWLTDDLEYAKGYAMEVPNRIPGHVGVVKRYVIDFDQCNGSIYDLPEDVDYYDGPDEQLQEELLAQGINSYCFYANQDSSYCMCLWGDVVPELGKPEIVFRTDTMNEDVDTQKYQIGFEPYGHVLNESKKIIKNDKGEKVPEKCDKCGGDVVLQIHGEPVYVCKDCGKYFGTMPFPKNLNENHEWCDSFEYTPYLKSISNFLHDNGINVKPFPRVKLHREEQEGLYVKTGYYDPDERKVHLFIADRHPKDVLRSFTHEMIHHSQNLRGDLKGYKGDTIKGDDVLEKLESEAYLKGNIYFRRWTEELRPEIPGKKKQLNESIQDIYNMAEDNDYGQIYSILSDFFYDKEHGVAKKQWRTIPAEQYANLLQRYMQDPMTARIPENVVYDWFENIVVANAFAIEQITELAGHTQWFPWDEVNDGFEVWRPGQYDIHDYESGYEALEAEGFYEWCSLPDGSDGWSDYGIGPIFNELANYQPNMPAGDLLVLINRVLHIGHWRGDLTSAFIEGGSQTCSNISGILRENFDMVELTNPEDVDLSSFDINSKLNPKFWKGGKIDSRVRIALLSIADDFVDTLDVSWAEPKDVIMTGSLANYNWSQKHSDVDLHILYDFKDVDKNVSLVKEYFDSKRRLWNDEHKNITIAGFQVELYVQDIHEPHASTGVYSLDKDEWLVRPNIKNFDLDYDRDSVKEKVAEYMNKIDDLCDEYDDSVADCDLSELHEKAEKLFDDIKNERRHGFEHGGGEYNVGNLIFKSLRRNGYIGKLSKIKTDTYDDMKSIYNENNEAK